MDLQLSPRSFLIFSGDTLITYKKRLLKYELIKSHEANTGIDQATGFPLNTKFMTLYPNGRLLILKGYAWDGPSGPTFDTKNFMRGSLVHDCLYQLMREGMLPQNFRKSADKLLRKMCRQDGMNRFRAWIVYQGVRLGGAGSARPPKTKANRYTAP